MTPRALRMLTVTTCAAVAVLSAAPDALAGKKCPYDQMRDEHGHCVGIFACPEGMIPIPETTFTMGKAGARDDQGPAHKVSLSPYCIDRTEVTNAAFRDCIAAGACEKPTYDEERCNPLHADRDAHPANCVTWSNAEAFCRWAGKRLPTEAEWELAARGKAGRRFPWGGGGPSKRNVHASMNGRWLTETAPVGSYPKGASPWGALDMSGNVCELVADFYAPYTADDVQNPTGPKLGTLHICRGGSLNNRDGASLSATFRRRGYATGSTDELTGLRCAAPPKR
ncbi:MAG: formylglycine-generating enzyme family protein [Deltaproteobacteria bacterium]|nr:MAG: formylglycine-generating enzyme family protein [Deltaproteobacteria bacterium]